MNESFKANEGLATGSLMSSVLNFFNRASGKVRLRISSSKTLLWIGNGSGISITHLMCDLLNKML